MTASLCLSGRGEYGRVLQMERARTVAVIHVQAHMVTVNVPEDRRHLRQGCQVFEALRAVPIIIHNCLQDGVKSQPDKEMEHER